MNTLIASTELQIIECPACRRSYAINRQLRADGQSWRCPYLDCSKIDHTWHRAEKSREEVLREEVERKDAALRRAWESRDEALAEANHFRKSRDGMKGALNKTKLRIFHGVCPCCKRSFPESALARHMKTKHPKYAAPSCEGVNRA